MDRAWQATVYGIAGIRHDLATKPPLVPCTVLSMGTNNKEREGEHPRDQEDFPWVTNSPVETLGLLCFIFFATVCQPQSCCG